MAPPRTLHNHCFQFLPHITVIPRESKDKFWGVNKLQYGQCEYGEISFFSLCTCECLDSLCSLFSLSITTYFAKYSKWRAVSIQSKFVLCSSDPQVVKLCLLLLSALVSLCCSLIINPNMESLLGIFTDFCFLWFFLSFSGLEKDLSSSPKQVDFLAGQSLLSQWTGVQASHPLTKSIVLKERKNRQKNLQLVLQHCCKTSRIAMLLVLPPTFKPVHNLICCKTDLMWVVKCATLLFNSFC